MSESSQVQDAPNWTRQWNEVRYPGQIRMFQEMISPLDVSFFSNKKVLNVGCGNGVETMEMAKVASHVTAVDFYTAEPMRRIADSTDNISFVEADAASFSCDDQYDCVVAIGVLHVTDDPAASFHNLQKCLAPGGTMIIYVYSAESMFLVRNIFDPIRKMLLKSRFFRVNMLRISRALAPVLRGGLRLFFSVVRSERSLLDYLKYLSTLGNEDLTSHIYDKLNAPVVHYISHEELLRWFQDGGFETPVVTNYHNVGWRAHAVKK